MKYIKTYWSKLESEYGADFYPAVKREPLHQFVLGSLLLLQHHEVELYTDFEGAKVIDRLKIPFSKVHILNPISSRYKSINDLYVLSLQSGPATLISDEILVTEKLAITAEKGVVIVFAPDLDSIKVVKSIIKVYRFAKKIPYFDDSFWASKSAYVDTALLGLTDTKILADYFNIINEFLSEYSTELAKIELSIVEDFFKRHWLYSYFRLKGLDFKMHINDINAGFPVEPFTFSKKNIYSGILKITGFHFLNLEFSVHFFHFFRLRFPTEFCLINEEFTRKSKPINSESFVRSYQFLNRANFKFEHQKSTAKEIQGIIKNDSTIDRAFLKDIFKYENALCQFKKELAKDWQGVLLQQQKAFSYLLEQWDKNEELFSAIKLTINPNLCIHESKWKWSTYWVEGVPNQKIAHLKVGHNLTLAPSYFMSAFVPNENGDVHEINLDRISAEILGYFLEPRSINTFFDELAIARETAKKNIHLNPYYARIRDLVKINILYIYEC